jgi:hypothetical protein
MQEATGGSKHSRSRSRDRKSSRSSPSRRDRSRSRDRKSSRSSPSRRSRSRSRDRKSSPSSSSRRDKDHKKDKREGQSRSRSRSRDRKGEHHRSSRRGSRSRSRSRSRSKTRRRSRSRTRSRERERSRERKSGASRATHSSSSSNSITKPTSRSRSPAGDGGAGGPLRLRGDHLFCKGLLVWFKCTYQHEHPYANIINPIGLTTYGFCSEYALQGRCPRGPRCQYYHWTALDERVFMRTGILPYFPKAQRVFSLRLPRNLAELKSLTSVALFKEFDRVLAKGVFIASDFDYQDISARFAVLSITETLIALGRLRSLSDRPANAPAFVLQTLNDVSTELPPLPLKPRAAPGDEELVKNGLPAKLFTLWLRQGMNEQFCSEDLSEAALDLVDSIPMEKIQRAHLYLEADHESSTSSSASSPSSTTSVKPSRNEQVMLFLKRVANDTGATPARTGSWLDRLLVRLMQKSQNADNVDENSAKRRALASANAVAASASGSAAAAAAPGTSSTNRSSNSGRKRGEDDMVDQDEPHPSRAHHGSVDVCHTLWLSFFCFNGCVCVCQCIFIHVSVCVRVLFSCSVAFIPNLSS